MSGRGRPRKPIKVDPSTESKLDVSPTAIQAEVDAKTEMKKQKPVKKRPFDLDAFLRNVSDVRSRIAVLVDTLDGADENTLKLNVPTAVKHMKTMYALLEYNPN